MPRAQPNPAAPAAPADNPLTGIGLMIASMWVLPLLDATGKWLMAGGVPILFMIWVRYAVHLLLMLALIVPARGWRVLRCRHPYAQIARGFCTMFASIMFFSALKYLHLAETTAINFVAPFLVLLAAPWILREPPRLSRWLATGIAFAGVLVIIRPGSGLNFTGVGFGLMAAFFVSSQHIVTRYMAGDDAHTSIIWTGAVGTGLLTLALPLTLPLARPVLEGFDALHWAVLLSTGISGGVGHLLQISAFRKAPASTLAPLSYFTVVSAAAIGWVFTGHVPNAMTWLGLCVICSSGLMSGYLEWRRAQKRSAA